MKRQYSQPYEGSYEGEGGGYDRDPRQNYDRPYDQGQASQRNSRQLEGPYARHSDVPYEAGRPDPSGYGGRKEPVYATREAPYGTPVKLEPSYSRPHEEPYRAGSQRAGTYNPYEQPQPSPQVPPMDYRTEVNTSRSGRLTATFKAEPIPVGEGLKLNPGYFKTCPGILKICQIILGMVCLGCSTPALTSCARLFLFVTATCYILTVLLCIIIVLGVDRALYQIRWVAGELIYTAIAAVCFSLASIVLLADIASYDWPGRDYRAIRDQYIAAGIFGIIQACLYGFGLFLLFIEWKATRPVPAPRTVTTN